jgi:hypothetical protein
MVTVMVPQTVHLISCSSSTEATWGGVEAEITNVEVRNAVLEVILRKATAAHVAVARELQ